MGKGHSVCHGKGSQCLSWEKVQCLSWERVTMFVMGMKQVYSVRHGNNIRVHIMISITWITELLVVLVVW